MTDRDDIDRLLQQRLAGIPGQPAGACLDAETIAAWHEGALPPAARRAAEAHAADCARCLSIMAAVARTAPRPSAASRRRTWFGTWWLAPVTAAAVTTLVWVLVERPRESLSTVGEPVQQAKSEPGAAPLPEAALPPAPPAEPPRSGSPRRESPVDPGAGVSADAARLPPSAPTLERPGAPAAPEARESARQDASAGAFADRVQAAPEAQADPVAAPRAELSELTAAAVQVVSPDPARRWRIRGDAIERTTDDGATWQRQSTITPGQVLAGTSPAPSVCWLAGRSGLVLLSTDGETWNRLPFPEKVDVIAIVATDARHATVTTLDGRSYRTSDGGSSWALQESAAAPF